MCTNTWAHIAIYTDGGSYTVSGEIYGGYRHTIRYI